jgi:hypothetical protein
MCWRCSLHCLLILWGLSISLSSVHPYDALSLAMVLNYVKHCSSGRVLDNHVWLSPFSLIQTMVCLGFFMVAYLRPPHLHCHYLIEWQDFPVPVGPSGPQLSVQSWQPWLCVGLSWSSRLSFHNLSMWCVSKCSMSLSTSRLDHS